MAYIPCRIGGGAIINIPNGKTVTPTDDIQTWLHCAGVFDNNYTTLAQILADTSVFTTLLADSNACDYMARSTSWALAEGVVPTMTDYTTPSGEVIYLNPYSPYFPWKAFDGDDSSLGTVANTVGNYIGYIFTEPKIIKTVFAHTVGLGTWKIQGRISGNWEDLATLSSTTDGGTYSVNIDSNDEIDAIRLYLNAKTGTSSGVGFYTLQFYEADITRNQDAMSLIGKYDYCSNALLGNATWAEALLKSDYRDEIYNIQVPKMTSNTTPSGTAFAGSIYNATYDAFKAFDKDNSTRWNSNSNVQNDLIGYTFTEPVVITGIKIRNYQVYTCKIQASNDGTNWTDLTDTLDITSYVQGDDYYFTINNNTKYRHYCVRCLTSQQGNVNFSIYEIQFYGRPEPKAGVIHCATNDVITITGNGVTKTVYADGNEGVLPLDLKSGLYTFTSSIAKNPANLSENYSKNILITDYTTDVYLMPDPVKTLYWWGYMSNECESMISDNGWNRSGYTFSAPTYSTNSFDCYASTQTTIAGIATKSKVTVSKVHAVAKGTTAVNNTYGSIVAHPSKTTSTTNDGQVNIDSSSIKAYELVPNVLNDYMTLMAINLRRFTGYAFWYE